MKSAELDQFLLWEKRPAKIIAKSNGEQVIIEMLENKCCPYCNGDLGKDQVHVIVSSPMYQEGAEPLKTIKSE